MNGWISCSDRLPECGEVVETKIDDQAGVGNVQALKRHQRDPECRSLWFVPDGAMCVYYEPTHWRVIQ